MQTLPGGFCGRGLWKLLPFTNLLNRKPFTNYCSDDYDGIFNSVSSTPYFLVVLDGLVTSSPHFCSMLVGPCLRFISKVRSMCSIQNIHFVQNTSFHRSLVKFHSILGMQQSSDIIEHEERQIHFVGAMKKCMLPSCEFLSPKWHEIWCVYC